MRNVIVELLWGAFPDSMKSVSDCIKSLRNTSIDNQLEELTKIERMSGLPAHLFGLVAMAKAALAAFNRFELEALKQSGLLSKSDSPEG